MIRKMREKINVLKSIIRVDVYYLSNLNAFENYSITIYL